MNSHLKVPAMPRQDRYRVIRLGAPLGQEQEGENGATNARHTVVRRIVIRVREGGGAFESTAVLLPNRDIPD